MGNLRSIKSKIQSTKNLKKITNALEVVSTVKMKKIKKQAESAQQYLMHLYAFISFVDGYIDIFENEYRQSDRELIILLTTDRGLAGSINTRLLKHFDEKYRAKKSTIDVYVVGKKGKQFCEQKGYTVVGNSVIHDSLVDEEISLIADFVSQNQAKYFSGTIAFNYFDTIMHQVPTLLPLFPVTKERFEKILQKKEIDISDNWFAKNTAGDRIVSDLMIDVSEDALRKEVRRQIITYGIFSAIIQNKTGEHASRMIAMKNAKDNASQMEEDLKISYNKLRQATVTQEISEIVSAKMAVENQG